MSSPTEIESQASDGSETQMYPRLNRMPFRFLAQMIRESVALKLGSMALCVAIASFLETLTPVAFRGVIDMLSQTGQIDSQGTLRWFIILLSLGASAMFFYRVFQWIEIYAGPPFREHIQSRMIRHLLSRSPASTGGHQSGALVEAIKRSSMNCMSLCELIAFDAVNMLVVIFVTAIVLTTEDSWYAMLVIGWIFIYFAGITFLAMRCLRLGSKQFVASGQSAGQIGDVLRNFETVFNYGAVKREQEFLGSGLENERQRTQSLRKYVLIMRVFGNIAVYTLFAVMTTLALLDVLEGTRTIGGFALVFTATNILIMSVFDLSRQLITFFENLGSLDGALDFVLKDDPQSDAPGATVISKDMVDNATQESGASQLTEGLSFRGVKFSYPEEELLFKDLNLDIAAGTKVGLVGPSGAGKTTLIRLLLRQLKPEAGAIFIDGVDISTIDASEFSSRFAVVSQKSGLFNRSIRDNIAYGSSATNDDELLEVAELAAADAFIKRRAQGLDSIVGEGGDELSGGESQRLSLARALLKPGKSILLLDEATSALDSESESQIQAALREAMKGRTVIAIAHRISTVMEMDRIIFLRNGEIEESGTHAELLALDGHYAQIWRKQAHISMRIENQTEAVD